MSSGRIIGFFEVAIGSYDDEPLSSRVLHNDVVVRASQMSISNVYCGRNELTNALSQGVRDGFIQKET